jgi:ABC-type sugar transport system ATPase subunit
MNSLTPDKRDTAMVFQSMPFSPYGRVRQRGLRPEIKKLPKDVIAKK